MKSHTQTIQHIRIRTALFMTGLLISGLTCFPVVTELQWARTIFAAWGTPLPPFIAQVIAGVSSTSVEHPFLFYGFDWLGFAHILFALLFYGVYKDPVKNIWVTQFGIIACLAIFPLAFIAGPLRGIPFWWQVVDSSFGIIGLVVMWPVYTMTKTLETNTL